jgi:hypothetical protein
MKASIPVAVARVKNVRNRTTGFTGVVETGLGERLDVLVVDPEKVVPGLLGCLNTLLVAEMPRVAWSKDGRTVFVVRSVGGGRCFGYEIIHPPKSSGCLVSGHETYEKAMAAASKHAAEYEEG